MLHDVRETAYIYVRMYVCMCVYVLCLIFFAMLHFLSDRKLLHMPCHQSNQIFWCQDEAVVLSVWCFLSCSSLMVNKLAPKLGFDSMIITAWVVYVNMKWCMTTQKSLLTNDSIPTSECTRPQLSRYACVHWYILLLFWSMRGWSSPISIYHHLHIYDWLMPTDHFFFQVLAIPMFYRDTSLVYCTFSEMIDYFA